MDASAVSEPEVVDGASWERLRSWIEARGLAPGRSRWEVYVTEPSPDRDPAELRTELNWAIEG